MSVTWRCRPMKRHNVDVVAYRIAFATEEDARKAYEAFEKLAATIDLLADVLEDAVHVKSIDDNWIADAGVALTLAGRYK